MVEPQLYPKLCTYAALNASDVVLDAGAGFGYLTCFLSNACRNVVAVEKDPPVAAVLREQVKDLCNVTVVEGDVLKTQLPEFNKVVAIPPYYLSSRLVTWILQRHLDCAVLIVQKEFADRLVASVGSEVYGWLTVLTSQLAEAKLLDAVPKSMFYPSPEVDSVVISLNPHSKAAFTVKDPSEFPQLVKWLFTQRNKKLAKAITPYLRSNCKLNKQDADKLAHTLPSLDRRVRELSPQEFGEVANVLPH